MTNGLNFVLVRLPMASISDQRNSDTLLLTAHALQDECALTEVQLLPAPSSHYEYGGRASFNPIFHQSLRARGLTSIRIILDDEV